LFVPRTQTKLKKYSPMLETVPFQVQTSFLGPFAQLSLYRVIFLTFFFMEAISRIIVLPKKMSYASLFGGSKTPSGEPASLYRLSEPTGQMDRKVAADLKRERNTYR